MDIRTFLGLSTYDQFEHFWDHCTFLEHHIDHVGITHHLYHLHDFYAELTSDISGRLDPCIHVFVDGPRLDKYRLGDIEFLQNLLGPTDSEI